MVVSNQMSHSKGKALVGILTGSPSDLEVVKKAQETLTSWAARASCSCSARTARRNDLALLQRAEARGSR